MSINANRIEREVPRSPLLSPVRKLGVNSVLVYSLTYLLTYLRTRSVVGPSSSP